MIAFPVLSLPVQAKSTYCHGYFLLMQKFFQFLATNVAPDGLKRATTKLGRGKDSLPTPNLLNQQDYQCVPDSMTHFDRTQTCNRKRQTKTDNGVLTDASNSIRPREVSDDTHAC